MAVRYHDLPVDEFPPALWPAVKRFNFELRNLAALEGTILGPLVNRRSDKSIARRAEKQVHETRITPTLSATTGTISIARVNVLPTAPAQVTLVVKAGPPDELYISMQITGGTWSWVPIVFAT